MCVSIYSFTPSGLWDVVPQPGTDISLPWKHRVFMTGPPGSPWGLVCFRLRGMLRRWASLCWASRGQGWVHATHWALTVTHIACCNVLILTLNHMLSWDAWWTLECRFWSLIWNIGYLDSSSSLTLILNFPWNWVLHRCISDAWSWKWILFWFCKLFLVLCAFLEYLS